MKDEYSAKFKAIESQTLGYEKATLTFERKFISERISSDSGEVARIIKEYRKYFFLLCVSDEPLSPSPKVDQAWHLHMLYSESYSEWCSKFKGVFIHHAPSNGDATETRRYGKQYQRTLDVYREVFEQDPPSDIWPSAEEYIENKSDYRWVDASEYQFFSNSDVMYLKRIALLLFVLYLVALLCF